MQTMNRAAAVLQGPVTAPNLIPVLHSATPACIAEPFMVNGKPYEVTAMSFGTPYGAVFAEDIDRMDVPALGAALGTHARFPQGADIVFVQAQNGGFKARLWQRGAGETDCTPEAVCVAGTAAIMLQKTAENEAEVSMGGGTYRVHWDKRGSVTMAPID